MTIAELNDLYRVAGIGRGNFLITAGVANLENTEEIITKVRTFKEFDEDNDTYGEHDFGSLKVGKEKIFFKIDYYNREKTAWCDPLDTVNCHRVVTIMLAEEY